MGVIGPPAAELTRELLYLLKDKSPDSRARAAFSLGEIRPADSIAYDLPALLDDVDRGVVDAAAEAPGKTAGERTTDIRPLLKQYDSAGQCDYRPIGTTALALQQLLSNASAVVAEHLATYDGDLRRFAEEEPGAGRRRSIGPQRRN